MEVNGPILLSAAATFVQEVQIFDKQAEEWDDNLQKQVEIVLVFTKILLTRSTHVIVS